jgi:hypothetical protein
VKSDDGKHTRAVIARSWQPAITVRANLPTQERFMTKTPDTANRPNQDAPATPGPSPLPGRHVGEPRGIDKSVADADKVARTGSKHELVRNTPPFGDADDTVPNDNYAEHGSDPKP